MEGALSKEGGQKIKKNMKFASSIFFRFAYFSKGSDGHFQRITNEKRRRIIGLGGSDACHVKML